MTVAAQFPHTRRAWARLKAVCADLAEIRYLERRCTKRETTLLVRVSDGTWWMPSSPQNFALAMGGLFAGKGSSWHLCRVRIWHGLAIASRKVFWGTNDASEFRLFGALPFYVLPPWDEVTESLKIISSSPDRNPKGGDAKQGSVEDEGRFPAPNPTAQGDIS